ncbi:MinD/ParA family protein [Fredinandcohnia quinoae]|uniref:MinD/ParA family protein n=1 Tax=Fredinandcohnia quinoae TaxID=2918902 RepID=A0AAW5DXJ3_9BACI|nr:MinD/ParA family protein [Fredinandcohnia sp. SECRCQ15]MCH1623765.1 MinD/ParA family protein [Fredinandcohnia sp. SECRCQ15]
MTDQAEALRRKLESLSINRNTAKTIAVLSGKGGVGKSNISLNFSIALSMRGKRVLLFDMDFGMGNIEILMGTSTKYSIVDMFEKDVTLTDMIIRGPEGIDYIAGGTGLSSLFRLDEDKSALLFNQLQLIMDKYDFVIFDMGAGMTEDVINFLMSVDEVFIVTTPEPTSITDAYSAMKLICMSDNSVPLFLIVNRAQSELEGIAASKRIQQVTRQFLRKEINVMGILIDDKNVQKAVSHQVPFILYAPKAQISKMIESIVNNYVTNLSMKDKNSFSFISKLQRFFGRRKKGD